MSDHNEPTQSGALPSVPLQPVVQLLIRLYEDYVELLGEELNELAPFFAVHGWKSKRAEKGKEYRAAIAELKSQLNPELTVPSLGADTVGRVVR